MGRPIVRFLVVKMADIEVSGITLLSKECEFNFDCWHDRFVISASAVPRIHRDSKGAQT